jgi:hypothetical protein
MLIVISGKAQVGKTTTTNILKEYFPELTEIVIAKSMKDMAKEYFNWNGEEETKPRTLLQQIGNYARFTLNKPDFFISRAIGDIQMLEPYKDLFVISDCRFRNELYSLKANFKDIITIRLERTNFISPLTIEEQNHESEIDLDDENGWDYVIVASNVDEIRQQVKPIIERIYEDKQTKENRST